MTLASREIVDKMNEAFIKGNTEDFLSYCSDDVVWNMVGFERFSGKDAVRSFIGESHEAPPEFTVKEVIADEYKAMAHGNMKMKNKEGVLEDHGFCDVYKIKDGKVTEMTTYIVKCK